MIEQVKLMVAEDALPGLYRRCALETRFAHQHAETLPVTYSGQSRSRLK